MESEITRFGRDGRPLLSNPNNRVSESGGIVRFGISEIPATEIPVSNPVFNLEPKAQLSNQSSSIDIK